MKPSVEGKIAEQEAGRSSRAAAPVRPAVPGVIFVEIPAPRRSSATPPGAIAPATAPIPRHLSGF